MPTLRKFFKHFAPKLMGTSANQSTYGAADSHYIHSHKQIRSRKERSNYVQFSEDRELSDLAIDDLRLAKGGGVKTAVQVHETMRGDDKSDKAILQTKTFTVKYT
jgi:hypothetical protein